MSPQPSSLSQDMALIPPSQKLAGNPKSGPLFALTLKRKSGESIEVVDPRATRALLALMDMQAVLGGAASHFGGPSALAELMSVTFALMFAEGEKQSRPWYELFHFVNDAGHCENGIYALRANYAQAGVSLDSLRGFRSISSPLTGHGEAHLFPEGVYLSNGPLGSAFPQSQGLCLADAFSGVDRTTVAVISDGACMEGEAREALASIPGLAAKGKMAPFVMILSDNNTKLSGRIDQEAFSMAPSFAALSTLGWKVIPLEKAHDLSSCLEVVEEAFRQAQAEPTRPVAIHAKTIKGYGVKKTAESASGGHGFPLKKPSELRDFISEIYSGEAWPAPIEDWLQELENFDATSLAGTKPRGLVQPKVPTEKIQVGVAQALIEKRQGGLPLFSVSADLPGSTGVAEFQKKFPEASLDVGVAEANMISLGAGLSKQGFIPVVDTFAQFGVTKGALPLTMAALSQAPMIAIFSHVGFQDAADGASHQALTYFAKTCSLPHTEVYSLTCSEEARALVGQAVEQFAELRRRGETPNNMIFFLGRENFPRSYQNWSGASLPFDYKLGSAQVVADNTGQGFTQSVTLVGAGSLLLQCLWAQEILADQGVGSVVVNPSVIHRPDVETLKSCLTKTQGHLLTVEEHQWTGGMGALINQALAQAHISFEIKMLGVQGEFGQSAYSAQELYDQHGLGAEGIAQAVHDWLK